MEKLLGARKGEERGRGREEWQREGGRGEEREVEGNGGVAVAVKLLYLAAACKSAQIAVRSFDI